MDYGLTGRVCHVTRNPFTNFSGHFFSFFILFLRFSAVFIIPLVLQDLESSSISLMVETLGLVDVFPSVAFSPAIHSITFSYVFSDKLCDTDGTG
jgi:hypothetical protein